MAGAGPNLTAIQVSLYSSCSFCAFPILQPLTRAGGNGQNRRRPRTEDWGSGEGQGKQEGVGELDEILASGKKEYSPPSITYWVGQEVHLGLLVASYEKPK